jgi:hypothetical protein
METIANISRSILNPANRYNKYIKQLLAARLFLIEYGVRDSDRIPIIIKMAGLYVPYFIDDVIE